MPIATVKKSFTCHTTRCCSSTVKGIKDFLDDQNDFFYSSHHNLEFFIKIEGQQEVGS